MYFSEKKIKLATCGPWFNRSGEGKSNRRQCCTKKWLPLFELLFTPSVRIREPELKARKLKPANGFRHLLPEWSSLTNKSKNKGTSTSEVLPRNWKKIQLRILRKRTFKKTRNLMNSETFRWTKKKKEKKKKNTQIQRTLFPGHLSQISFPQIALKFAILYLFYPILSRNSLLKMLLSVLSFRTNIRTRNLLFEYCLTVNGTLKSPNNITQLNTKLDFSVTHFIAHFILS